MSENQSITPLSIEEVKIHLDKLDKGIAEIKKEFYSIQRSLDAIYEDRDLLTDLANDIAKVRQLVISADKHNEELTNEVAYTVEKKSEEVKAEVTETSQEVKEKVISKVIHGIHRSFMKRDLALVKVPWWKRLFSKPKLDIVEVAI